jgi:transcriptional regulator with PAS, ATPase and Fis domain
MPEPDDHLPPGKTRPAGSKPKKGIRNIGRLFDAAGEAMWIVDAQHVLVYFNAQAGQWLGHEPADLVGRLCHRSLDRTDPTSECLAAIAPPLGLTRGGDALVDIATDCAPMRSVRFTMHGRGDDAFVMAITGAIGAVGADEDLQAAIALQKRLQSWRRQHATAGLMVTAGSSAHANRIRSQVQLAASTRQSIAIKGPRGSGGEWVGRRIHWLGTNARESPQVEAEREQEDGNRIIMVESPLMDAELLEATLSPAAAVLGRGNGTHVTLILRGLDESTHDVQERIVDFAERSSGAVRMIGLLNDAARLENTAAPAALSPSMALAMSVFEVRLPALSERAEDIALIATALLENRHAAGKSVAERLSRAALDRLILYPWPDNFDELRAAIRHASSVCPTAAIGPDDLPLAIRSYRNHGITKPKPIVQTNLDDAMRDFELSKIRQAIEQSDGNRSEAARILGISRARLLRRLDDAADPENAQ